VASKVVHESIEPGQVWHPLERVPLEIVEGLRGRVWRVRRPNGSIALITEHILVNQYRLGGSLPVPRSAKGRRKA
jgi:hypothetical protein